MNYFSNALNHLDGERIVDIKLTQESKTVRVSVFNTWNSRPGGFTSSFMGKILQSG